MRQGTADALQRELSRRLDCHIFDCHPHSAALQPSGAIGFERRFDHAVIGTVSNVAFRFCVKPQQAGELLSPVCGWFAEGFDTLDDLKEAKALFDE
jgi:hypothetical protein